MAGVGGEIVVGAVAVEIVPSAKNFLAKLLKDVGPDVAAVAKTAGESIEKELATGTSDGVKKGLKSGKKDAAKEGAEAGADYSGGFAAAVKAGLNAAQKAIGDFKIDVDANLSAFERFRLEVVAAKKLVKGIGDEEIKLSLNDSEFKAQVEVARKQLVKLAKANREIGTGSELRNSIREIDRMTESIQAANTKTGAFAKTVDNFYKGVLDTFADTTLDLEVNIKVDGADAMNVAEYHIDQLRRKVAQFREDNAKGLLDGETINKQIADITGRIESIGNLKLGSNLDYEFRKLKASSDAFLSDIQGKPKLEVDTGDTVVKLEGINREIKRLADSAAEGISVRPEVQDDQVAVELERIKREFEQIAVHIGVDLNDSEALAQIALLHGQLQTLAGRHTVNVGVGAEAQKTLALLERFTKQFEKKEEVQVDTKPARIELEGFDRDIKAFAEKAASSIALRPHIDNDALNDGLREIKRELTDIAIRVGVDLDDNAALARLRVLEAQLGELGKLRTINVGVGKDAERITKSFDKFFTDLDGGEQKLVGFGARVKAVAQSVSGAITIRPELQGEDAVYTELAKLKAAASDIVAKINVEYDDHEAYQRLKLIDASVKDLGKRRSINVGVDREVANISSIFSKATQAIDGTTQTANKFVSTIQNMGPAALAANTAVVGLGITLPFVFLAATSAIAGFLGLLTLVGAVAGAAALGVGVLVLALSKVTEAIKEREDAAKTAGVTAAQNALNEFNNKNALVSADNAVASAEKALAKARVSAARSVASASRSLANAQRNLVQANERETDARKKLATSYADAKQDLKDLNEEIRKNRIEQQAANVTVLQAREALNAAYADPTSSGTDIAAAEAAYNTAEQNVRSLRAEQEKNAAEKAKYDKYGLDANAGVISAQAALKTAIESVKDAQDSVTQAALDSAQAQIDAADSVNDAEAALAQARTNRADTLKQQQLTAAVAAATGTQDTTAFDSLTDKAKAFVEFYETNIKPVLDDLFKTAQDSGILGGIAGFFDAIRPILEPLKGLIGIIGHQMGVFFIQIGNFLGSDEGKKFIDFLGDTITELEPIMASLAKSGLKIFFKLLEALAPVIEKMGPVIADMLERFADSDFTNTDQFQEFLQNLIDDGPKILELIGNILGAIINIINALAPAGDVILSTLNGFSHLIATVSSNVVAVIIGIIAILFGAVLVAVGLAASTVAAVTAVILGVVAIVVGIVIIVAKYWDQIKAIFKLAWASMLDRMRGFVKFFEDLWQDLVDWIVGAVTGFADSVVLRWRTFTSSISDLWDGLFGEGGLVRKAFSGFIDWAKLAFQRSVDLIGSIWSGLKTIIATPILGFITLINDGFIGPLNLVGKVFDFKIDPISVPDFVKENAAGNNKTGHFATGGIVPGGVQSSKRDDVVATLRRGEGILVPEVVQQLGPATILDWNRRGNLGQKIRGFALGGLVDDIVKFERKSGVPFSVTSGVRDTNDYHGRGMAVDTADTAQNMVRLASWLYGYSPYLLELIHSGGPGYFVKNGAKKNGAFYGRATVLDHYDHVHTAMNEAGLNAVKNKVPASSFTSQGADTAEPTGLAAWAVSTVKSVLDPLAKAFISKNDSLFGKMLGGAPGTMLGKITGWLIEKAKSLGSSVVNGVTDAVSGVSDFVKSLFSSEVDTSAHGKGDMAGPQAAAAYAKSQLSAFGWDSTDMSNLAKLWNGESGWRWNAKNPDSGAYGIPQSLPGTKMASVGSDWATNAFTQVLWGMGYIKERYKNPTNAYLSWLGRDPHWYDTGGYLPPGLTLAYNGTGRHERVMTYEQEQQMLADRKMALGVTVRVEDGAVPGLVSAEVDRQFNSLADAHIYGGV